MKFYLSSFKIGNQGKKLKSLVKNKKIGYIPNALDFTGANSEKINELNSISINELNQLGLEPEILDLKDYFGIPEKLYLKLDELKAVYISGGNTFVLRQAMRLSGFDRYVQTHLDDNDFVYAGFSAAICILYKDMEALQIVDKPDDFPYKEIKKTIWEGLGVLDYLILPHYNSDHSESEGINQEVDYCKKNNIPYKTLRDGEVIILE
jgi:dipeptidase E